jgi:DNA-binding CsgD family transcriptional regulator
LVSAYLEVWGQRGPQLVDLAAGRATVGRGPANDVALPWDRTVSSLHAVFQRYASGWSVRDLGSTNGTFVNNTRVTAEHRLRNGDEVMVGASRLVFRLRNAPPSTITAGADPPPRVTRRERDVLLALCGPLVEGDMFTEAATVATIAERLVVTEAAVKFHLANLYDKFGVHDAGEGGRRSRLANEAIRRRALTLSDLRSDSRPGVRSKPGSGS